jgi:hypothetical protein
MVFVFAIYFIGSSRTNKQKMVGVAVVKALTKAVLLHKGV